MSCYLEVEHGTCMLVWKVEHVFKCYIQVISMDTWFRCILSDLVIVTTFILRSLNLCS